MLRPRREAKPSEVAGLDTRRPQAHGPGRAARGKSSASGTGDPSCWGAPAGAEVARVRRRLATTDRGRCSAGIGPGRHEGRAW